MKHKAKRLLSIFLALALVMGLAPAMSQTVQAATVIAQGTFGADGNNLTWSLGDDFALAISGNGAMSDYSLTNRPWNSHIADIKTVTIGSGVTVIGERAFQNCTSLQSVSFEENSQLTNIKR